MVVTCSLVSPVPFCVYNITQIQAFFNSQCSIKLKLPNYAKHRNVSDEAQNHWQTRFWYVIINMLGGRKDARFLLKLWKGAISDETAPFFILQVKYICFYTHQSCEWMFRYLKFCNCSDIRECRKRTCWSESDIRRYLNSGQKLFRSL